MRRQLTEMPVTRAGRYGRFVVAVAVLVTLAGIVLVRNPHADFGPAFAVMMSGLGLGLVALAFAFFAFVQVWREGAHGLGAAVVTTLIAGVLLAYPAYAAIKGLRLPAIIDVSTDTEQPPAFSRSRVAFAARGDRYPPEPGPAPRQAQKAAYTQIAPLTLDIDPDEAFELARKAALNRKWQIVEANRPGGRIGNGHIDAVAHTRLLNLPADVTVRVRPRADGSRIDVRSATRVGSRDFGDNAERIRSYLDEVANLAIALK